MLSSSRRNTWGTDMRTWSAMGVCFAWIFSVSLASAASVLDVEGGALNLSGAVSADRAVIGSNATLNGAGTLAATTAVYGVVSPGVGPGSTATLIVGGPLTFHPGARFECYASAHTVLDRLTALGAVSGVCTVLLTKAAGAVPLNQIIIDANAASTYTDFRTGGATSNDWLLAPVGSDDLKVTDLAGDTDGDSLSDWWEFQYFASRTTAASNGQADADGMDNYGEYVAGTDPTSAASVLRISQIWWSGTNRIYFEWPSVTGRQYRLMLADAMTNAFWGPWTNAATPPTNQTYLWFPAGVPTSYFYSLDAIKR
jgi:hypothetical protein